MFLTTFFRAVTGHSFFEYLVEMHLDYIQSIAYSKLKDRDLAEEITQETLLKLNKYRNRLKKLDEDALRCYIYKTIQSVISNYFRQQSKEAPLIEDVQGYSFDENIENRIVVSEILNGLTPKQRDLLIYRYFMGYKLREIAQIMHINPKNINMEMKRAKEAALKASGGRKHE